MAVMEKTYTLPSMAELRIVTGTQKDAVAIITLKPNEDEGSDHVLRADIFGTELTPGVATHLPLGRSFAIFTPTGCTLTLSASPLVHQTCYGTLCGTNWSKSLVEMNAHLESRRVQARQSGPDGIGPRVLVLSDRRRVGTSTYVRILVNYALRLGYHPLLLDAAGDVPRFAYPGAVALYAMQHGVDVEEEMSFVPALHAYVGGGKHEEPALFLHTMHQLMQSATERMARSDRCRVGGLFLDYGVISPAAIEEAEAWEYGEDANKEERRKVHPLDTLIDTIVEVGVDHVFVVKSAWLRFKISQRVRLRYAKRGKDGFIPRMTTTPLSVIGPENMIIGLYLLEATASAEAAEDDFVRRQRWLQYFFGTRTSPIRPTLLTLEVSLVRLVQVGRGEGTSMSTFMPMDDQDEQAQQETQQTHTRDLAALAQSVSLTYVMATDVDLKNRIVAMSAATELEELADGTLQRVPFALFETRLRKGFLMGFALVESVSATKITLLTNAAPLRKDCGICLILMEERLATRSG